MNRVRTFTMIVWSIAVTGCSTSYKATVATYTSTLPSRGKMYYGAVTPELKKELVLNDAALVCLVDKDQGLSGTAACRCSDGSPDSWDQNCSDWLK
jgi:hypothetical protein